MAKNMLQYIVEIIERRAVGLKRRFIKIFILAALMCLCFSGCFSESGDGLYSLPKAPDDYIDLQSCIDVLLAEGARYAGPVSGSNRQAVQLVDLNGDGVQEALAFMTVTGEKPMRVYLLSKNMEGEYARAAEISGDGAAFDCVEYSDVDGDGVLEIILGFQMSDQVLQYVGVYDISDGFSLTLITAGSYTEYKTADLDRDGAVEMLLFKLDSPETAGTADYYDYCDGEYKLVNTVPLSLGMESIKRIKSSSYIEDGVHAVFVSGTYQSTGLVTDVFAVRDRQLVNVAMPDGAEVSLQAIRNYIIYPTDVDSDGVVELARPVQMPVMDGSTEAYYTISWYSQNIDGNFLKKLSTYHNYSESWYFIIPEQWEGNISVSRTDSTEGKALTFYRYDGEGEPQPLFTIYSLTGDHRQQLAEKDGRFVLYTKGEVIYCAEITPGADSWEQMLTMEEILAGFKPIRTEWNTGEV
ncbi:MAG: VCBS repeat-containing protein [Ruminococcaceae bacterium]|nr:VCBS repeat-containing protein [Oscillospiraceae bacterium]